MNTRSKVKVRKEPKDAPRKPEFNPSERKQMKFIDPKYPKYTFFDIRFNGKYTREQIQKYVQGKSNEIKRKHPDSPKFMVTLKYEGGLYRAGARTTPGDPVSLWSPEDSDGFDPGQIVGFNIMVALER